MHINSYEKNFEHIEELLLDGKDVCRPFVIGEFACGNINNRSEILDLLQAFPKALTIDLAKYLYFIDLNHLSGVGIGYVDVHLIASAQLPEIPLRTNDKKLKETARNSKTINWRGDDLLSKKSVIKLCFVILLLLISASTVWAQNETVETAERLMIFQLEALKSENHQKFIEHGNKAFRALMDEYSFDSLVMQRKAKIAKGYRLEYLGDIRSIGMRKHLWKVYIAGEKYQLLGTLSLSHGKVVGFNLE